MTTALVWFRQDLRLADNPALRAAVAAARHVVPVFIWSPEEEGDWAPGAASRWWLHESLQLLAASLQARGSQLVIRRGPTVETVMDLIQATGASQVYWNRRYEPAAIKVEQSLQKQLESAGTIGHGFHSSRLAEPGLIKSAAGAPYQVFTPFWRAFLQQLSIEAPQPSPPALPPPVQWPVSLPPEALQLLPKTPWHRSLAAHWKPGEMAARGALRGFVEHRLARYADDRDRPDLGAASRLSPYLHHGELSPRQVWTAVVRAASSQATDSMQKAAAKFCTELIWREFATQQLLLHPLLPDRPRDPRFESIRWRDDAAEFRAWTQGRTGFAMVDAGMRELWQTGWMHNRVRMVTASFLVKNLLHPWQQGERWFWDTLVDADLASNALNWQWVAGSSPDAAPWFRVFNPELQADKFDPEGDYRSRFASETPTAPIVDLKATRERALAALPAGLNRK